MTAPQRSSRPQVLIHQRPKREREMHSAPHPPRLRRVVAQMISVAVALLSLAISHAPAEEFNYDRATIGERPDGRIVVPTNQVLLPAGRNVDFKGRPTDLALSPDGRRIAVLNRTSVLLIDRQTGRVLDEKSYPTRGAGGSYTGIAFTPDGKRLLASNVKGTIEVFDITADDKLGTAHAIAISTKGNALPAGMTLTADGKRLLVALNISNTLAEIDLATEKLLREIPVGNAPFDVVLAGKKAYVSNWAGRHPQEGDTTGPGGRLPIKRVKVDPVRHIANEGSVSVVDLDAGKQIKEIIVGLHTSGMTVSPDARCVFVANANSDTVSIIDTQSDALIETISTRPSEKLLFGSAPNALTIAPDGRTLYASNGTNNAVAVIILGKAACSHSQAPDKSAVAGFIPTGWYPAGLAVDPAGRELCVVNIKGIGSRESSGPKTPRFKDYGKEVYGFNSHDYRGSISLIQVPDAKQLAAFTDQVIENNRQTASVSALAPPRPDAPPRVIPQRHGEPSLIRHVLYIIKENRTYDQVFGDLPQGNGDPNLVHFPREVTPNHHKLAETFTLFDNFYCSGTLSADGHQWAMEAYVTDYLEKAYGGFPRSYPYEGEDAMAYASSGFLWDNALAHKKTLRIYGEFVHAKIEPPGVKFLDCYNDFIKGINKISIRAEAAIKTIEPYICPTSIGFPLIVPDVHRAAQFLNEFKAYEEKGELPHLMIMLLPADHTSGTRPGMPTPRASVADNDLSLGRIVEAVTRSRFWKETAIFVVQDDPQAGVDHVDGHRTVALVISPYTRRGFVDSTNYNQTGMIRTMELILGLPPMNQFDASATPMTACFTDKPDLTPYEHLKNNIPLDELNPQLGSITDPRQLHWAKASIEQPLDDLDEADEDTLNRIIWHSVRGYDTPYPVLANAEHDDD